MASPWVRIGWRNLGRNRRRTILTAGGLAVGYCGVVVLAGLTDGMVGEMLRNGTGVLSGQIQIHAPDYLPERDMHRTIGGRDGTELSRLLERADAQPGVAAAAPRVYAGGLVSTGGATIGATLIGIDPTREARTTLLLGSLREGRVPRDGANEILLGSEMARTLDAQLGDEIVVVAPAADGSLGNDLFTVSGIYHSGIGDLDVSTALLPIGTLQRLLALDPGRIHEVVVRVPDPWAAPGIADALQTAITDPSVAVQPWTTFRPEMADYARLAQSSFWLVLVIVFTMAIFGVANTLLMATFERRFEIALLRALGAGPGGLVRAIVAEALALGVIATGIGALVGLVLITWWHHKPPDLSVFFGGFSMMGSYIRPVLRTEYPWPMFGWAAIALILTAVLAALYPAYRAIRTPAAETLAGR
ncbi:MAG: ABC transporter permease [Gemmatimonadota bacterium]|nr:ABC transporter permease [Gemmatimonadota bacterium]MDH5197527.1 ABC transporter permease [Gemmatimonadota bacterium]